MARQQPRNARSPLPAWITRVLPLALAAAAVYINSAGNGFIQDDKIQLLKNPLLADPRNVPRLLFSSVWSVIGIAGNYYRPVQFLIYMAVYQLFGFSAPAYHALMIGLHAVNTVLVFLFVRRMASSRVAVAAAALFAVHPIHSEVVNWVAALPDLVVTTVILGGMLWLAGESRLRVAAIAGHCILYLTALLSKETGVVMLPLYAAFAYWQGRLRRDAALYAAMVATFGLYIAMRLKALGALAPGQATYFRLGPAEFAMSAVVTAARYLADLVWPIQLNYFHVFHPTRSITPGLALSLMALAAAAAGFLLSRRLPPVGFGIFWIAVTLLPALNLTGVGQNVYAERYLYLPSAGFCWVAAFAWDRLAKTRPALAKAAGVVLLIVMAARTFARNPDWRDEITLLRVTVAQSPDAGLMHNALAGAYIEADAFDQALEQERLAIACEPEAPMFYRNLGNILLVKEPKAAVSAFEKFVAMRPDNAEGRADLGLALEAAGEPNRAALEYGSALQLEPRNRDAAEGLRRIAASNGR